MVANSKMSSEKAFEELILKAKNGDKALNKKIKEYEAILDNLKQIKYPKN